ncbi:MAG: transposase, partial [Symbiobacterium thermophilum]
MRSRSNTSQRGNPQVTNFRIALEELLRKSGVDDVDFLREGVRVLAQGLMELEVSQQIGAERYERSSERSNYRNGYRERQWDTRVGTIDLQIPKLRKGSYMPSWLEPRRRAEKALVAVVQEAYIQGVSTRKVDELVQALGMTGVSKSQVSRLCAELDEVVEAFRNRPLEGRYPYVWLDAKYEKVRENGRVSSMALVIAMGVREDGEREILGLDVGPSEDGAFWTAFLRQLVARGLKGVLLVISDNHVGLREAIRTVFSGASWQRCRVHFMRNLLGYVPKNLQSMVSAAVRTIFAQPDQQAAKSQLAVVVENLRKQFPRAAQLLEDAEEDILAYMAFPTEHWRRLHSTNPLERLNREIGRRTEIVGIFPNREALIRLAGAVMIEQQEEWMTAPRRYFSQASMAKLY